MHEISAETDTLKIKILLINIILKILYTTTVLRGFFLYFVHEVKHVGVFVHPADQSLSHPD